MKKMTSALALIAATAAAPVLAEDITITVWAGGSNDSDHYRIDNIRIAADMLSREAAIRGEELNITVEGKRDFDGWDGFKQAVTLGAEAGNAPNIVVTSHLDIAPWLIVIFAQRWGTFDDGTRYKHYYVPESVGIATGLLITALHHAGLSTLTHTPNPMKFLNGILNRPEAEKPVMILAVGHPAEDATVPAVAKIKKPLEEILSVFEDQE